VAGDDISVNRRVQRIAGRRFPKSTGRNEIPADSRSDFLNFRIRDEFVLIDGWWESPVQSGSQQCLFARAHRFAKTQEDRPLLRADGEESRRQEPDYQ